MAEAGDDHGSYMGVLIDNLTLDAWVVIVILAVMFVIAAAVMVAKSFMIGNVDKHNRKFLKRFRDATSDLLSLDRDVQHPQSSLFRLYQAGLREVRRRTDAEGRVSLTGASIDAIKAAVDADMVRETHKLNAKMVLLTIAISGGPFLGLLGTVVGVMITFAAIAAAGDVNVNAIAPGIAAALLATVAGLAVAIPALFGYNYLASRIKNVSADMQIFVDEFITRIAEKHGA
jgi:biopolymer transport protein ExbB